ncbi:MAG TPA: rhomboid family intramembrane serine protease [Myxococcota bacterium]|nr:rhomboid family intramembrane serine protease [Myxococcota bacterium]
MIPIRDENPTLGTSIATFAVIGANVAAWVFVQGLGAEPALTRSVCAFGAIPGALLGHVPPGASVPLGPGVECVVGKPGWYTLVTSMFMHGGWFHILGNMWFLSVFGDNVEDAMGHGRFLAFYLLCGIAAALAHVASSPGSAAPVVGASGAIGGVMGAYAALYPRAPVHIIVPLGLFLYNTVVPAYLMLGWWFLLQVIGGIPALQGAGGGVAFWAHVGGFAAGIALLPLFRDPVRVAAHRRQVADRFGAS